MINYCVYCNCKKRSVLLWKICSVNPPSSTLRSFFVSEIKPHCEDNSEISDVFVGKTKDSLDRVNSELVITEVIAVFGPFVKFTVAQADEAVGI